MTAPEQMSGKERVVFWDNIKGFLILLVVVGHYLYAYWGQGYADLIVKMIYFMHMPAFIFVSGFFSKSTHSRSFPSLLKLIVLYMIFNSSMMIFSYLFISPEFNLITPYNSYWFLIALVLWRSTAKYAERVRGIEWISILVAVLIGLWGDVTNVFAIGRTIAFYPFFIIGYKFSGNKIDDYLKNRKPSDYIKGFILLLLTLVLSLSLLAIFPELVQSYFVMEAFDTPFGILIRIFIFCIAALSILVMVMLSPKKSVPLLSKWGKNSLAVYVLHRILTLLFILVFPVETYHEGYILYALAAALFTLLILGSHPVSRWLERVIGTISSAYLGEGITAHDREKVIFLRIMACVLILFLLLPVFPQLLQKNYVPVFAQAAPQTILPVLTREQKDVLDRAVSISFVGDLILLQDQVRNAYTAKTGKYNFSSMFEYASPYLREADLAIGIFEGPAAGEAAGYSTSNYGDGLPLFLNVPDSFVNEVKASGIDLVSVANNHILDKGENGAVRTLDTLDRAGLLHVGFSKDKREKNAGTVVEAGGIRIAVLAYTYGCNGYSDEELFKNGSPAVSLLADPSGRYFKQAKEAVLLDFQHIKKLDPQPDLIIVIPHMGTQFSHQTDRYQNTWNDFFIKAGADIILGSHSHAVQPVEFRTTIKDGKKKQALIVNCPGNFANSYTEHDGDAAAIAQVYIDPASKEPAAAAVIPMYTQSVNGMHRALPVYSILTDPDLSQALSAYEMERVKQVHSLVTSVMLRSERTLDRAEERYYMFPGGAVRSPVKALEITDEMKETELYKQLRDSKSVCFMGDSITVGSENGGYGWYEPMTGAFPEITVYKEAWASATTLTLLENADAIADLHAELYVTAIGTNDVRYRDKNTCAMDTESYIRNLKTLTSAILAVDPNAKFVFISPWHAQDNDPYCKVSMEERDRLLYDYSKALERFCEENDFLFIDPNTAIDKVLVRFAPSDYLLDHIHPNAGAGILLFSEKVLNAHS